MEAATSHTGVAVDQACDTADAPDASFDITVENDIPLGIGLGSPAAVVAADIDAAVRELGLELEPCELVERVYQVEHKVQDGQTSRTDTFCSAMGGTVRAEGDDRRTVDAPPPPSVIGSDGGAGGTGVLVSGVRALRGEYSSAADTVSTVGDIVHRGEELLAEADPGVDDPPGELLSELSCLIDFNHGLLKAFGVSSHLLDSMVWAARGVDAYGAKLTDAGGDGCTASLNPTPETQTTLWFTPGCKDAFRIELVTEDVRVEVLLDADVDARGEAEREHNDGNRTEAGTDLS